MNGLLIIAMCLQHSKGMEDSKELGWSMKEEPHFSWESLTDSVGKFIRGLNFQYRVRERVLCCGVVLAATHLVGVGLCRCNCALRK